ncbi:hypothetical protein ACFFRR_008590 [Megaselia abdita]
MMKLIGFGGFVCGFLLVTVGGYGFGRCPKYPSMPKFNLTRILGDWYEVERSFYLPEIASGCTKLAFQPENENAVKLNNIFRLEVAIKTINRLTGSPSINIGYATPESSRSSIMDFKFNTRFPDVISRLLPGSGKYQVLFSDYDNFAILWSCASLGPIGYADQIWIFGRDRDFNVTIRSKIYDSLKRLGLEPDRLVISKNKNCPITL